MRNVIVTLDEETARWARIEAARRDMSVSSYIRQLLRERMGSSRRICNMRWTSMGCESWIPSRRQSPTFTRAVRPRPSGSGQGSRGDSRGPFLQPAFAPRREVAPTGQASRAEGRPTTLCPTESQ